MSAQPNSDVSLPGVRLSFIGGGNMARSLIGGLVTRGLDPRQIIVSDPVPAQLAALESDYDVAITSDNSQAAGGADVVVFAVKPQDLRAVATGVRPAIEQRAPLLISIAAGVRIQDIERWTGRSEIVRAMPNRPALEGCGVTGLYAGPAVSEARRAIADAVLGAVGRTVWLERESDLDAVTAISGSGPAYFFLLIEMLERAGVALGLAPEVSRILAVETAYGAGAMARAASESPETLRRQVTSKGGTTEAALRRLEARDVAGAFQEAIAAAARRASELADELGRDP